MTLLRVYGPDECGPAGNPLDWLRCRTCEGTGEDRWHVGGLVDSCTACDGHGSLHEAALASRAWAIRCPCGGDGYTHAIECREPRDTTPRCEDCQHPQSEGTWDGGLEWNLTTRLHHAERAFRRGHEPDIKGIHYSRCDEQCNHGGPGRIAAPEGWRAVGELSMIARKPLSGHAVEASWRPVDVRCLSGPMDLRPESLFLGCLRCYAARLNARP